MKPDRLEEYVARHRNEFDSLEPGTRVWKKIRTSVKSREVQFPRLWRAAAILMLVMLSLLTGYYLLRNRIPQQPLGEVDRKIPALMEAEIYYTNIIQQKLSEVEAYLTRDPGLLEEIRTDMSQLDAVYNELKQDLKDKMRNGEVVEALIQNYRIKIRILEDLLEKMQKEANENNEEIHEQL